MKAIASMIALALCGGCSQAAVEPDPTPTVAEPVLVDAGPNIRPEMSFTATPLRCMAAGGICTLVTSCAKTGIRASVADDDCLPPHSSAPVVCCLGVVDVAVKPADAGRH